MTLFMLVCLCPHNDAFSFIPPVSFSLFPTTDRERAEPRLPKLCPVNGRSCRRSSCSPALLYPPHELVHFIIRKWARFQYAKSHFSTPGGRGTHARPGAFSFDKNTRVRKPKDKAKVEVSVQVVERWILARLRDRKFIGLAASNQAIRELLDELNQREMKHLGQSRLALFIELDQPRLAPLPVRAYEYAVWKVARVHVDYHVVFEKHYYSVPYTLSGKEVHIRATEKTLEIFYQRRRVASHPRSKAKGRFSTHSVHMPPEHQFYSQWSPERFLRWAREIGEQTTELVSVALDARGHPEQAYRTCLGILGLAKRYSKVRLEAACTRANAAGIHSYRGVNNILKNKLDQQPLEPEADQPLPPHENIRGKNYYH